MMKTMKTAVLVLAVTAGMWATVRMAVKGAEDRAAGEKRLLEARLGSDLARATVKEREVVKRQSFADAHLSVHYWLNAREAWVMARTNQETTWFGGRESPLDNHVDTAVNRMERLKRTEADVAAAYWMRRRWDDQHAPPPTE